MRARNTRKWHVRPRASARITYANARMTHCQVRSHTSIMHAKYTHKTHAHMEMSARRWCKCLQTKTQRLIIHAFFNYILLSIKRYIHSTTVALLSGRTPPQQVATCSPSVYYSGGDSAATHHCSVWGLAFQRCGSHEPGKHPVQDRICLHISRRSTGWAKTGQRTTWAHS